MSLDLSVSRETEALLGSHLALVERWQPRINLVAAGTMAEAWSRHVLDSLQLSRAVPRDVRHWVDLGAGAGFPGLVVAIDRREVPDFRVTLVESQAKKAAFLREVARLLALPVRVAAVRLEEVVNDGRDQPPDVVSARALAPLDQLVRWTWPWLSRGTLGVFPKGKEAARELTATRASFNVATTVLPSVTEPGAALVLVRCAPEQGGASHGGIDDRGGAGVRSTPT